MHNISIQSISPRSTPNARIFVGNARTQCLFIDCEQCLFGQSRLSSAGLERANSREEGKRECEASESRGKAGEKALFSSALSSSPRGQFALSSPAEHRPKRKCSQSSLFTSFLVCINEWRKILQSIFQDVMCLFYGCGYFLFSCGIC